MSKNIKKYPVVVFKKLAKQCPDCKQSQPCPLAYACNWTPKLSSRTETNLVRRMNSICPYCGNESEFVTGKTIYPHRPDLHSKAFYRCRPCKAYVGCHPGTITPLGRLANEELRRAKNAAHAAFDPIWKNGQLTRKSAYAWLANQLNILADDCHIGMFDVDLCNKTVEVCRNGISK